MSLWSILRDGPGMGLPGEGVFWHASTALWPVVAVAGALVSLVLMISWFLHDRPRSKDVQVARDRRAM